MSLKDAFSGLKEELGKDLQSEDKKDSSEDESNLTFAVNKSSKIDVVENSTSKKGVEQEEEVASAKEMASLQVRSSRQRKRKVGKRSNPEFTQAPAFIRKTTHQQVKINLITDPDFNDYSELVEALLVQWLEKKKKANS